jgi:PAT family beta-lactamase induction signal transducer AmpG
LIIAQIALIISISGLGQSAPAKNPWLMTIAALLVAFFSSSQDIIADAYRREDLKDEELGLGSSLFINGYRVGMLFASGGGLIMADSMSFPMVYQVMAGCMLLGLATTLLCKEPEVWAGAPKTIKEAVISPLSDYFSRKDAIWILGFILLYKVGDTMASSMTMPFFLEIGFSKSEIGTVVKLFGFWATIIGGLFGGVLMLKIGINRSLWIFGILQALSTACFAILTKTGHSISYLSGIIAFENLSSGMGTAAFAAFMASITNKKFTATQYALLTSLMGVPRVIVSAPTGYIAKYMGWFIFFILCAIIAIPGLMLLIKFAPWSLIKTEKSEVRIKEFEI